MDPLAMLWRERSGPWRWHASAALVPLALAAVILPERLGAPRQSAEEAAPAAPEPPGPAASTRLRVPRAGADAPARTVWSAASESEIAPCAAAEAPSAALLELLLLDAAGWPAPLASVEFVLPGGARRLETADHRGRLALALEPGALEVVAWSGAQCGGPLCLELAAGITANAELSLLPSAAVEGRVVDAQSGAPLSGATVAFWTHSELDRARTGADGTFRHERFPLLEPHQQVRVEAQGYAPLVRALELDDIGGWIQRAAHADERDQGGSGTPWLELALMPELVIRGRVLGPDGAPCAAARVEAVGYARLLPDVARRDAAAAETDGAGRFALAGLSPEISHALSVRASGLGELVLELPAADATAPLPSLDLGDLALARAARLDGHVADAAGRPAADAEIELRWLDRAPPVPGSAADPLARPDAGRRTARTDAAGRFAFEELAAGRYALGVRRDRGVLARLELVLAEGEAQSALALVLAPECRTLTGRVHGPAGPLAGASIELERFGHVARLETDAAGAFRVAGLDDLSSYTLRVSALGFGGAERSVWCGEEPLLELAAAAPKGR